jgi:hypothetical protein
MTCVFCSQPSQGNYTIHRDGLGLGPELPLCDACGEGAEPSCGAIWAKLAADGKRRYKRARYYEDGGIFDVEVLSDDLVLLQQKQMRRVMLRCIRTVHASVLFGSIDPGHEWTATRNVEHPEMTILPMWRLEYEEGHDV